ncbi:MAG: [protein-PII] uridylyltransferase [Syntrophobacteraceae bacterium]|jgi:[protein-PII] uridylyltransferase|nr:[protein-PII] uridylyltransferase [Syntrophobacteraceae bacterium]
MAIQRFSTLFRRMKDLRQAFEQECADDIPGLLATRTYAIHIHEALQRGLTRADIGQDGWCLAAVGGFGRGELSFRSDLDLLFLHQNRMPQSLDGFLRELIYGLWDAGFEVGHATTSVTGAKKLVQEDFTILTNHLEARLVAGDSALFEGWRASFLKSFGTLSRRRFIRTLVEYRQSRMQHYGESSYLLEPHIKEGVGGMRDLHAIRWAAIGCAQRWDIEDLVQRRWLIPQEAVWLEQAGDFLWRVRLQLHRITGRRQDQLLFPEQEQVALRLGFRDVRQGSAAEAFMRLYYRHVARIRRTTSFFLERVEEAQGKSLRQRISRRRVLPGPFLLEGRELHFMDPSWVGKNPGLLMQIFWQAARSEAHFHHQTGSVIRENLSCMTDQIRSDPVVVRQFVDILMDPRQAFRVLKVMLETGFLESFIPGFTGVRYKVQYDFYHLYTVDEHLLRTILELHRMEGGAEDDLAPLHLPEVFKEVVNRKVLFLAALFHDIGKGVGKGHADHGARMAPSLARQFRLSDEEEELLGFLIEKHLLLAETALKRDLMDEKPILRCAFEIGDRERLRLLYLLTIADSRATGPGAWNVWRASLLRELFLKTDRALVRGEWSREDLREQSDAIQGEVLSRLDSEAEREAASRWLDQVSFRYVLSQPPEAIVRHYAMERQLEARGLVMESQEIEGGMWQITVATRDRPGLFSMITGVLWVAGLNILAADIFTRPSGVALDILRVERVPDPLRSRELFERIHDDLERCLADRSNFVKLMAAKGKPSLLQQKNVPVAEDRIVIDEDGSDFYTIIEVYTWDRPGVLHAITSTLYELGISIQLAKISTPGAQVADIFYVTDLEGSKLLRQETHERVRARLLSCLLRTP